MKKEDLEKKYPIGSRVDLLGSKYQGIIRGNFRLMKPINHEFDNSTWSHLYNFKTQDQELKEIVKESRKSRVGESEWFVDVEVLGEIKPLNIMMLA